MWRKIASLGGGQFMAIHQDGGMMAEHSRWDDELARLHDKLGRTAIGYGAGAPAAAAAMREAEAAPAPVKAARAAFMANNGRAIGGKGDLVDAIAKGEAKLADVQAELPADMRAMDKDAQAAVIASKQKERQVINERIVELSKLRRKELDAREEAAARSGAAEGFDVAAKKALKKSVKRQRPVGPEAVRRTGAMSWRFRDHRRFQWDTMAIVAVGSGIGTLAWAWPLTGAGWWMATGVGPLLAGLAGRSAHLPPRRSLLLVATAAVAGAALAGTTWHGLASPPATLAVGEAMLVGVLSGLAASLGLALVHLERVAARPLVGALSRARASLSGDELALAERAVAAHDRIASDLGGATDADGRRLARMAEDVTLKVLAWRRGAGACAGSWSASTSTPSGGAPRRWPTPPPTPTTRPHAPT